MSIASEALRPFWSVRPLLVALCPLALALASPAACAQASSVAGTGLYAGLGTTGLLVGMGQTYSPAFGSRLEFAGLPGLDHNVTEAGIDYRGELTMRRAGAALDWHPFKNGFRLSLGLSWVKAQADLTARAMPGTPFSVGNASVTLGPTDGLSAKVELPRAMPYLGLGWGQDMARGWSIHADLGALIGKPRVSGSLSASLRDKIQLLPDRDPEVELNNELQQIRDQVSRPGVYPVVQLGLSYRW